MKVGLQILSVFLLSCGVLKAKGQNETYLQPFSSRIIANPAFAGLDNNTSLHVGNQYYSVSEDYTYNLFYVTYDKFAPKLKGGMGLWFQHGLLGHANTSTSELGFSYTGFKTRLGEGNIRFTFHGSALLASKQWFAYVLDQMFIERSETPSPPGKQFNRYFLLKPGFGFLIINNSLSFGLNGRVPLEFNMSNDGEEGYQKNENVPISLNLYLSKQLGGNRKGLKSSPFKATPELLVFYNEDYFLSRLGINFEHTDKSYGAFMQNDYTNNIHQLGGMIGYRLNNMQIELNTGIGLPGISDEIGISCELSLRVVIPPVHYSKSFPWASEILKRK